MRRSRVYESDDFDLDADFEDLDGHDVYHVHNHGIRDDHRADRYHRHLINNYFDFDNGEDEHGERGRG
jgi:hypothetical protein